MRSKVLVDFLDKRTRELQRRHTFRRDCIFCSQVDVGVTDLTQQIERNLGNLAVLDNARRDFLISAINLRRVITHNLGKINDCPTTND